MAGRYWKPDEYVRQGFYKHFKSVVDFQVFEELCSAAGQRGNQYAGAREIANKYGHSVRAVRYAISRLKALGLIEMVEGKTGRTHVAEYKITWSRFKKVQSFLDKTKAACQEAERVQEDAPLKTVENVDNLPERVQQDAPIKAKRVQPSDRKGATACTPQGIQRGIRNPEGVSGGLGEALKGAFSKLFKGPPSKSKPAEVQKAELRQWAAERGSE